MDAYHAGKAAKVEAPATISQTSLPSQNGPMALIATRCSVSVRPTKRWSAPTPKSNPSSTMNPVQNTATTMNQKICILVGSSVGQGWFAHRRGLSVGRRRGFLFGRKVAVRVAEHQNEVDD